MHGLVTRMKLRVSLTVTIVYAVPASGFLPGLISSVQPDAGSFRNRLWRVFFMKQSESLFWDASERRHATHLVESQALSRTPQK